MRERPDHIESAIANEASRRGIDPEDLVTEAMEIWLAVDDHVRECLDNVCRTHGESRGWRVNQAIKAYTYGIASSENERTKAKR